MTDLATLIDRVMLSGEFRSLRLSVVDGKPTVFLERGMMESFSCGQLVDEDALPSDHMRDLLEMHTKEGRWAFLRHEDQPKDDEYEDLF